jgi:hypothetical protein
LFDHVVRGAVAQGLVTGHHVSQDSTLVRANCSFKSIEPIAVSQSPQQYRKRVAKENPVAKEASVTNSDPPESQPGGGGRNPEVNFRGQRFSNATHRSTTDPDARLMRHGLGREAQPSYQVHYTMDNRTRFTLDVETTCAEGTAEIEAGLRMLTRLRRRHGLKPRTAGADKGYFVGRYLMGLKRRRIKSHVAVRNVAIRHQARTAREWAKRKARSQGYAISQRLRKLIEELFGEGKDLMGLRRMRLRTLERVREQPLMTALAQNLKRLVKLRQLPQVV